MLSPNPGMRADLFLCLLVVRWEQNCLLSAKERNKDGGKLTHRYSIAVGVKALNWQI